jgi:hypothetical protein
MADDRQYSGTVFALAKGEYPAGVIRAEGEEFEFTGKLGRWMETPEQRSKRVAEATRLVDAKKKAEVPPAALAPKATT